MLKALLALLVLKALLALLVLKALLVHKVLLVHKALLVLRVRRAHRVLKVCPVAAAITSLARKLQPQPYLIPHLTSASTQVAYCQRLYPTSPVLASRSPVV